MVHATGNLFLLAYPESDNEASGSWKTFCSGRMGGTAGSRRKTKTKVVMGSHKLHYLKGRLNFLKAGSLLNTALSKAIPNNNLALFVEEEANA